jgi:cold shock CspA family protein
VAGCTPRCFCTRPRCFSIDSRLMSPFTQKASPWDSVGTMATGTSAFWRDDKGYGRIVGDDGEEFFVHLSGIPGDAAIVRSLTEGQRVSFIVGLHVAADDDPEYPDETVRRVAIDVSPLQR